MLYRPRDPVPRSLRWLLGVPAGVPAVASRVVPGLLDFVEKHAGERKATSVLLPAVESRAVLLWEDDRLLELAANREGRLAEWLRERRVPPPSSAAALLG